MTNRAGNANAKRKIEDTSMPPWASWRTRSLPARAKRFMETYCIPSKGQGFGKPIKVAEWQMDWIEEVLADGMDSAGMTLPRGNGKSTFAGAFGSWALFDPKVADQFGGQPDIPLVGVTLKQLRKSTYGAAVAFRKNHPDLADRSLQYTASGEERILVPYNSDGELYPIAADVDGLQGLDPMIAIADEFGFMSVDVWDTLLLAGGKRPRSLILGLGTRSPDEDPNALDHLLEQMEIHGSIDGFHMTDYSADTDASVTDREQWYQANPALAAGYLRESALESALKLAPAPAFKCFRLNIKTGSQTGWLGANGPTLWDESVEEFTLSPTAPTYLGLDKSAYGDCSAVAVMQRDEHDRWLTEARIFFPEGGAIRHADVTDHIRTLAASLNVVACGYDDRYAVEGAQTLEEEGVCMVKVPQTPQRLVPAFSALYEDFQEGRIIHREDPVFRAHVLSAVPRLDTSGGFTLAKNKSKVHIDAAVALGIARAAAGVELDEVLPEHIPAESLRF